MAVLPLPNGQMRGLPTLGDPWGFAGNGPQSSPFFGMGQQVAPPPSLDPRSIGAWEGEGGRVAPDLPSMLRGLPPGRGVGYLPGTGPVTNPTPVPYQQNLPPAPQAGRGVAVPGQPGGELIPFDPRSTLPKFGPIIEGSLAGQYRPGGVLPNPYVTGIATAMYPTPAAAQTLQPGQPGDPHAPASAGFAGVQPAPPPEMLGATQPMLPPDPFGLGKFFHAQAEDMAARARVPMQSYAERASPTPYTLPLPSMPTDLPSGAPASAGFAGVTPAYTPPLPNTPPPSGIDWGRVGKMAIGVDHNAPFPPVPPWLNAALGNSRLPSPADRAPASAGFSGVAPVAAPAAGAPAGRSLWQMLTGGVSTPAAPTPVAAPAAPVAAASVAAPAAMAPQGGAWAPNSLQDVMRHGSIKSNRDLQGWAAAFPHASPIEQVMQSHFNYANDLYRALLSGVLPTDPDYAAKELDARTQAQTELMKMIDPNFTSRVIGIGMANSRGGNLLAPPPVQ